MKRIIKLLVLIISLSFFVGCGKAEVGTDVKINKNGSTESTIRVAYDNIIGTVVNNDLLNKVFGDKYGEINKYTKDGLNVEEVIIKTNKIKLSDMINTFKNINGTEVEASEIDLIDEYVNLTVDTEKGLFFNTYTVKANLKKNLVDEIVTQAKGINSLSGTLINNMDESIRIYLGNIPYTLTLNIPFQVVESNGNILESNTVEWDYTLADLNPDTSVILSFKAINLINIAVGIIILLIVIISSVVIIRKGKKA